MGVHDAVSAIWHFEGNNGVLLKQNEILENINDTRALCLDLDKQNSSFEPFLYWFYVQKAILERIEDENENLALFGMRLIEKAIIDVYAYIRHMNTSYLCAKNGKQPQEYEKMDEEKHRIRSCYMSLLERLFPLHYEKEQEEDQRWKVAIRMGVLLASLWLQSHETSPIAKQLLQEIALFSNRQPNPRSVHVLLGLVYLIESNDISRSLIHFEQAHTNILESNMDPCTKGFLHFWYAIALYKNSQPENAFEQLKQAIRLNYHPVYALNLKAWFHLQDKDYEQVAEDLQRALEIEFESFSCMFNYSLLLGKMENFPAQEQILAYLLDAKRLVSNKKRNFEVLEDKNDETNKTTSQLQLFLPHALDGLICGRYQTRRGEYFDEDHIHLYMAYASFESEEYEKAKKYFEAALLPLHQHKMIQRPFRRHDCWRDYIYTLLETNHPSKALEICHSILRSQSLDEEQELQFIMIHLCKADALFMMEKVEECQSYLSQTIDPKVTALLETSESMSKDEREEISSCHMQILNNLAVTMACHDDLPKATELLRRCIKLYPDDSMNATFNLVLLLWRQDQKESACIIWMETRGWKMDFSIETLGFYEEKMAQLTFDSTNQDVLKEHVQCEGPNGSVSIQQIAFCDALVLNHWLQLRKMDNLHFSLQHIQSTFSK
jgi:tetratricopeptide (TPR) repeat protein